MIFCADIRRACTAEGCRTLYSGFYCDAAGLAIELDGSQHYEAAGQLHDAQRTEYLEGFGIRVLRFSNLDVMQHFEGVCRVIDNAVKSLP